MQDLRLFAVARPRQFRECGSGAVTANLSAETLAAYERWAPLYPPMAHNPLMRAEQQAMVEQWPPVAGSQAIDLACGTGRYARLLAQAGAARVVAADFCMPMLEQAAVGTRIRASMMQLPFRGESFDLVICGLALGHAPNINAWMSEVARILKPGGTLVYSDFHPEAARTGLTRSFIDAQERTWTVPHHSHELASQMAAAAAAGLTIDIVREIRVGIELREPFPKSEDFYRRWDGVPIVLVVRARR
jgi:malonyl-CoA O-methyltransferase